MQQCHVIRHGPTGCHWWFRPNGNWAGALGCHRCVGCIAGRMSFRASRDEFAPFDNELFRRQHSRRPQSELAGQGLEVRSGPTLTAALLSR